MKYTVCLHNGGSDDEPLKHRLMSRWIKAWLGEPWSHVELHRGAIYTGDGMIVPMGDCYSASGYEGEVRKKHILFSHSDRWTIIESPDFVRSIDENIMATFDEIEGRPYDYLGAILCPIRPTAGLRNSYYCIEAVRCMLGLTPFGGTFIPLVSELYKRNWKLIWHEGKAS